jgi:hypothetical protein
MEPRVEIQVGTGKRHGGSGTGVYDHLLQLRIVRGCFDLEPTHKSGAESAESVPGSRIRVNTFNFDWQLFVQGGQEEAVQRNAVLQMFIVDHEDNGVFKEFDDKYRQYRAKQIDAETFRFYIDDLVLGYVTNDILRRMCTAYYEQGVEDGAASLRSTIRQILLD